MFRENALKKSNKRKSKLRRENEKKMRSNEYIIIITFVKYFQKESINISSFFPYILPFFCKNQHCSYKIMILIY